jgi:hypothetical protein
MNGFPKLPCFHRLNRGEETDTSCCFPASLPLKELFFQYDFDFMTDCQYIMAMGLCFVRKEK